MKLFSILLCLCIVLPVFGQPPSPFAELTTPSVPGTVADPASFLGLTLPDALTQFGPPLTVRAVRGPDPRQDDVVFSYGTFELYWFRDRVWQVALHAAYGVRTGDGRATVAGVLGDPLIVLERAYVYLLPNRPWPVRLRVGFSPAGGVESLFVFRADF